MYSPLDITVYPIDFSEQKLITQSKLVYKDRL